jgi:hypothetical protein
MSTSLYPLSVTQAFDFILQDEPGLRTFSS